MATLRFTRFALLTALLLAPPACFAVSGKASAVTYLDAALNQRVQAFVASDSGRLVENQFNGTSWSWVDHGFPPGTTAVSTPVALTYVDANGNRRVYVFARSKEGKLVLRFWNGFQWQWVNQGGVVFNPGTLSATTFLDSQGNRRIYVFMQHLLENSVGWTLVSNYWDGSSWNWVDHGTGPGGACGVLSFTETVNYIDSEGQRRMDVFCSGSATNTVFKHTWSNGNWNWVTTGGVGTNFGSAVTFVDAAGVTQEYFFTRRPGDTIWQRHGVAWIPLAAPTVPGAPVGGISAIAWTDEAFVRRMQVFTQFGNTFWSKTWNGSAWSASWTDHGFPPGSNPFGVQNPSAISYLDIRSGTQRILVFGTGENGNFFANYWNGATWQWFNNGKL